VHSADIWHML